MQENANAWVQMPPLEHDDPAAMVYRLSVGWRSDFGLAAMSVGVAEVEALDLAAAVDAVAPAIDVDRVAALRAAIANGSYRADPIAIAQRIIAADQPLPGPTTSVTGSATGSA